MTDKKQPIIKTPKMFDPVFMLERIWFIDDTFTLRSFMPSNLIGLVPKFENEAVKKFRNWWGPKRLEQMRKELGR